MKEWVLKSTGQIERGTKPLELVDLPEPEPGPGEVRIKVFVCGGP